jgi:hypothetical protein
MATTVKQTLTAKLTKNTSVEKGGAWLLHICIQTEGASECVMDTHSAWSNPSAAKRFLKQVVLENTPRKSIKMETKATNDLGKPTHLAGELNYKWGIA